jgi:hypothetical protein
MSPTCMESILPVLVKLRRTRHGLRIFEHDRREENRVVRGLWKPKQIRLNTGYPSRFIQIREKLAVVLSLVCLFKLMVSCHHR